MPSASSLTSMVGLTMLAHREDLAPLLVGPAAKQAPLQRSPAVSSLPGHCRTPVLAFTTQCKHILGVCTITIRNGSVWTAELLSTPLTTRGSTHALLLQLDQGICWKYAWRTPPVYSVDLASCWPTESIFQAENRAPQAVRGGFSAGWAEREAFWTPVQGDRSQGASFSGRQKVVPGPSQESGHLVFLSARPESYKGFTEGLSFKRIFEPLVRRGELKGTGNLF